jgi:hypothetical protein
MRMGHSTRGRARSRRWRKAWHFVFGPVGVPRSSWARAADAALFGSLVLALLLQWFTGTMLCHHELVASGSAQAEMTTNGLVLTPVDPGTGQVQWEARQRQCGWPFATVIAPDALRASWSLDEPMETRPMGRIPADHPIAAGLIPLAPPGTGLEAAPGRIRWTELIFGTAVVWMGLYFAIRIPLIFLHAGSILRGRHRERVGEIRSSKGRCPKCNYNLNGLDYAAECPECGALLW